MIPDNKDLPVINSLDLPITPLIPSSPGEKAIITPKPLPKNVDDKLLSHLQADFYIREAPGMEGNQRTETLEYMLNCLSRLPEKWITPATKQLIKDFEQCHEIAVFIHEVSVKKNSAEELIKTLQQKIVNLQPGERLLIPGGWDSMFIGHAMLFMIHKQEDGAYTLETYNSGSGMTLFHDYTVDAQGYRRYKPVVVYKDISPENMLSSQHLLTLMDPILMPLSDKDGVHGAHIIYDSILPCFKGTLDAAPSDFVHAIRGQRAGTCAWKVLMAMLSQINETSLYKSLRIEIKMINLQDYFDTHALLTADQRKHLMNDLEKLARDIKKGNHTFNDEEKKAYFEKINALKQLTEERFQPQKIQSVTFSSLSDEPVYCESIASLSFDKDKAQAISNPKENLPISLPRERPAPEHILSHLQSWRSCAEKLYQNGQYEDVTIAINEIVRNLPMPTENINKKKNIWGDEAIVNSNPDIYWGEAKSRSDQEIEEIVIELTRLSELLMQCCFQRRQCLGDEIMSAVTCYAIQVKLLENYFHFQRSSSGHGLIGFGQKLPHEIAGVHLEHLYKSNLFAHNPILQERALQCCDFFKITYSIETLGKELSGLHDSHYHHFNSSTKGEGHDKYKHITAEIQKKAIAKGITIPMDERERAYYREMGEPEEQPDLQALVPMLQYDYGQFGLMPPFLAAVNKQNVIASYLANGQSLTNRHDGCEDADAFTVKMDLTEDEFRRHTKDRYYPFTPSIKGATYSINSNTAANIQESAEDKIENSSLRRIIHELYSSPWAPNPNEALTQYKYLKEISAADAQELLTLVHTPQNMKVWQTAAFFQRALEKLQISDYQIICEMGIYPHLGQKFLNDSQSVAKLLHFITSSLDELQSPTQIESYAFLVKLGVILQNSAQAHEHFAKDSVVFPNWEDMLLKKWQNSSNEDEKHSLETLMAYVLSMRDFDFNLENLTSILLGLSRLRTGQAPIAINNATAQESIMAWLHKHEPEIRALCKNQEMEGLLCQTLLNGVQINGQAPKQEWHQLSFPVYESQDGQIRVNLQTGETRLKNGQAIALPRSISEHPTFIALFGTKKRLVATDGFNCFNFEEAGKRFSISDYGHLIIKCDTGSGSFEYMEPASFFGSFLVDGFLGNYSLWLSKRKILLMDRDLKISYVGDEVKAEECWRDFTFRRVETDGTLSQEKLFQFPYLNKKDGSLLQRFEETHFLLGWKNAEGKASLIEAPRYGLKFNLETLPDGREVYMRKGSEDFISYQQTIVDHPYLHSYLMLENAKGKKKLLIPLENLERRVNSKAPLLGTVTAERDESFCTLEISLDKKGGLIPANKEQALYLAYLALAKKDYDFAGRYIMQAARFSGEGSLPMIEKLLSLDGRCRDNHPKAQALLLRAGIMQLKEWRYTSQSSAPETEKIIKSFLSRLHLIYHRYHDADLNAGHWALKHDEEKLLLQEFIKYNLLEADEFSRFLHLYQRTPLIESKHEADPLERKNLEFTETREWNTAIEDWEKKFIPAVSSNLWKGKETMAQCSLIRPSENLVPYFLQVCLHAEEYGCDPNKKAELDDVFRHIRWTYGGILPHVLLKEIVANRDLYADSLKELASLSSRQANAREVSNWFRGLAYQIQTKLTETPKEPVKPFVLAEKIPRKPPSVEAKPVVAKTRVEKSSPVWTQEHLNAFFEITQDIKGEELPELTVGLALNEAHQKHHISLFNEERKAFYQTRQAPKNYSLKNAAGLEADLTDKIAAKKGMLAEKLTWILAEANKAPAAPEQALAHELAKAGGERGEVTFEELLALYLRGSEHELFDRCPGLNHDSKAGCKLIDNIGEYLLLATERQQCKRAQKWLLEHNRIVEELKKNPGDVELEKQKVNNDLLLYKTMTAERQYDPSQHPECLLLEYGADIILREDQTRVLHILRPNPPSIDPAETELIVQLIMGAGKTKVLLPLLALQQADGEKLSMVIAPTGMYETNRRDLKITSGDKLFKEPITFEFDRSTPCEVTELRNKLWSLQEAILQKTYVVTTAESLLALKLKYQELLDLVGEGRLNEEEAKPQLKVLGEILNLIHERGWAILDEADTILDIRRELNFPLGRSFSVPKERVRLVNQLYNHLLSPPISEKVFIRKNKPEVFSKETYRKEIAPQLAKKLMEEWDDIGNLDAQKLEDFLTGKLEERELAGLKEHPNRQIISLAKELISTLLPATLSKKGNESYGLSHETNKKYPIPYKANNTPDESSEFGNIYETLLYGVNIYAQNGLSEAQCDELLAETQRKIRLESKDKGCRFAETDAYKRFVKIYGAIDPFTVSSKDKEALSQRVKNNPKALFHWLSHFVYPEIQTSRQKISGNALMLIDMLAHAQGFTGTPWNRVSYHTRLYKPEREKEISTPESEFEILHAIYQNVKEGGIRTLKSDNAQETLNELLQDYSFDCLIDVGALLNGITNKEVAEKVRNLKDPKGVIFFNEKNELVVQLKGVTEPILMTTTEKGLRGISYYDQRHTTGADIDQRSTAKAVLTFRDKTLRDMTQGAMRMRQLLTSQAIEIVLPKELSQLLASEGKEPSFESLLQYAIVQQSNHLADVIVRSTKVKLHRILQHEIDRLIMQERSISAKVQLHKYFSEVLTDLYSDDPYLEFGQSLHMEDTLKVLKDFRQKQLEIVQNLISEEALTSAGFSPEIQQKLLKVKASAETSLEGFVMPDEKFIPAKIPEENAAQMSKESKVEIEKEMEVHIEAAVAQVPQRSKGYSIWGTYSDRQPPFNDSLLFTPNREDPPKYGPQVMQVNQLLQQGSFKAYSAFFDKDLCATKLFYDSVDKQREPLMGQGTQKKCYQLLFVVEPTGESRAIMVDPVEASSLQDYMPKDQVDGRKMKLLDINSKHVISKGPDLTESEREKFEMLLIQTKFLNSALDYSKREKRLLERWLAPKDKPKTQKLFETIVSVHLGMQEQYEKSWMKKFLKNASVG